MIGEKLQELLELKNIKAGTLATKTGIPKSTIYSIIKRNNKNVDFSVMEKISDALDVPVEYFYDRQETSPENEKKPVSEENGLDEGLLNNLMSLTPEEIVKVAAFVQGLLASR